VWGAHAKVRILSELVVQRASSRAYAVTTSRTYRSSTGTTSGSQALDVAAVIKASQAISGEIVLDQLLATLMDIIVATAGAERGSLVLDSGGRMLVQARKTPGAAAPHVMEGIAPDQAAQLSPGILNYVFRTRQHVVLDDAAHTSRFRADPYVRREGVKSLLCAPIVHKGALKGALYLENNLVTAAFTPDRLEALNVLLSQIAVSIENATLYAELGRYRDHLEELVAERTRELKEAQQDLVNLSRRAGMAEIAAGVLHNVGNVMNSVNVGASVAREAVAELQVDAVLKVAELLGRNAQDLSAFLIQDDRGRKVPEYLGKLGAALAEKQRAILTNIDYMMEHLDHMKRIVSAQQSYAKSGGVVEGCSLAELVETALAINAVSLREKHIEVVREFEALPPVLLDRHGVLQILVNLVSNAKHALEERGGDSARVLRVAVRADGSRDVSIEVQDNGVGIAPEVIAKIFNHGFTTRRNGHGFGLHNSANAAQAMQGRLTAHSDGPGHGARFVLQLPARFADERGVARHA
jgi:signal transduction histidine kinase